MIAERDVTVVCATYTGNAVRVQFPDQLGTSSQPNLHDYESNQLNQYTRIENPDHFVVNGEAPANLGVKVNEQPADRMGLFWSKELGPVPNENGPSATEVTVTGTPAGTNEPSLTEQGWKINPKAVEDMGGSDSSEELSYDEDGNLTSDSLWIYTWGAENRLLAMEFTPSLTPAALRRRLTFSYDVKFRRVSKTVEHRTADDSGRPQESTSRYLWRDWSLLGELHQEPGEDVQGIWHVWGNDVTQTLDGAGGVGGLLATFDHTGPTPEVTLPTYDGNGNIAALIDGLTGEVVGRYDYSPFGQTVLQQGPRAQCHRHQFSTKPVDEETGLVYYGFRYLDTAQGRSLVRDLIGERGGTNLQGFVINDTMNRVDVLGMGLRLGIDLPEDPKPEPRDPLDPGSPSENPFDRRPRYNLVGCFYCETHLHFMDTGDGGILRTRCPELIIGVGLEPSSGPSWLAPDIEFPETPFLEDLESFARATDHINSYLDAMRQKKKLHPCCKLIYKTTRCSFRKSAPWVPPNLA